MEERSRVKHHFIKGQMILMPGGTLKYNRIATNITYLVESFVRQKNLPYLVSNGDTKIWIPAIETFYYPDAEVELKSIGCSIAMRDIY
jgi:Uma2 family endonuclease